MKKEGASLLKDILKSIICDKSKEIIFTILSN